MSNCNETAKAKDEQTKLGVPLRVIIIEDVRDVRDGLRLLINGSPDFHCDGGYRSVEDALAALDELEPPDIVLTDLGLPGLSGIEGIRLFRERLPDTPILALTIHENNDKIFNALCAGATGYLLKNTASARLLEALKESASGGAPMSPEVARRVVQLFRDFRPVSASYDLTPQERQLLKLLVEGHHKKTAAHEMGISFHTVSFHLKNIYGKLQVHSKSEAVAKALREHLV
ncbi:MAG: response regulator transcription factor [Acidobacteria bacterium]|nr:response regulator transcription factor [Acidobacteriota bacterium]